jgi:outer membrane receptor protein involved in Fe transport
VVDPLSAGAATVARGANGMAYGASTLGSAINFVSPTARGRERVELRLSGGSHGLGTTRATGSRVLNEQLDGLVTIEAKSWDGYRDHNEQRRQGLYANVGWRPADAVTSRFFGTYLHNDQKPPGSLTRATTRHSSDHQRHAQSPAWRLGRPNLASLRGAAKRTRCRLCRQPQRAHPGACRRRPLEAWRAAVGVRRGDGILLTRAAPLRPHSCCHRRRNAYYPDTNSE